MADTYLGESIGKLGFGFMRLPKKGDGFDYEPMKKMVDTFLSHGFSYFDTAFVYQGSEESLRETLVRRHPREKFKIATKLPSMLLKKPDDLKSFFDTSIKRLGVDFIDFYLLHGLSGEHNKKVEELGGWEFLRKLKDEGKIRHYGFSYHDTPENLDLILSKHPDTEFVQLQINYLDWDSEDVQSRRLYETARKHGKPVIIMEPVKGGLLAGEGSEIEKVFKAANPNVSAASWAVRFAASLEGLITMLSGMTNMQQLKDNIKTIKNLIPLSSEEMNVVHKAVKVLRSIPRVPCTGCRYCVDNCPEKINIPSLMNIYSDYLKYRAVSNADEFAFSTATMNGGKPSSCITCRVCESRCPQHIEITSILKQMVNIYENRSTTGPVD